MAQYDEDELQSLQPLSTVEIDINNLTESKVNGKGVFDKLLSTASVYLEDMYSKGYITKKEYSDTFISLYQNTLQQATAFTIEREKLPYDIKSQEAQTNLAIAQTKQTLFNKRLLEAQIIDVQADTKLKELNQVKIKQDIDIGKDQKALNDIAIKKANKDLILQDINADQAKASIKQVDAQIKLAETQLAQSQYELKNRLPKEIELIDAQVVKMKADSELSKEQVELAKAQLLQSEQDLEIKKAQLAIQQQQLDLARSQLKYQEQKVVTETAQTDGSVIKKGSAMAYANSLMQAQTTAYTNDHLVKTTKLMYDVVTAGIANDVRTANSTNKLDDSSVGVASTKLQESINT